MSHPQIELMIRQHRNRVYWDLVRLGNVKRERKPITAERMYRALCRKLLLRERPSPSEVVAIACQVGGVDILQVMRPKNRQERSTNRVCAVLAAASRWMRQHRRMSYPEIGRAIGRSHSTVMSFCGAIKRKKPIAA